jgi:hypothetical protein
MMGLPGHGSAGSGAYIGRHWYNPSGRLGHVVAWACSSTRGLSRCCADEAKKEKSLFDPPMGWVVYSPWTFQNRSNYPWAVLDGGFATVTSGCYSSYGFVFSFLFISVESLKIHSKSQKNHKIENLILLDSTWVDLYSEYIIWYVLV